MIATHRGHEFQFLPGRTHPQYSIDCMLADEKDFREKYWDVRPGDVVVDAGASYGAYSLAAAASGFVLVVAFEPEPTVFTDLCLNIAENQWQDVCTPLPWALWDRATIVNMRDYAPHWPQQTITGGYPGVRLDSEAFAFGRLDWFKLDVEGAEMHALRGARETLTKFKPRVIVECHDFLDATLLKQCRDLLEECGIGNLIEVPRPPCTMLVSR